MERHLSPPLSHHEESSLDDHNRNSPRPNIPMTPYTPPRSHPDHTYSYDDPEQYEVAHSQEYYDPPSYRNNGYRTPPQPIHAGSPATRSGRVLRTPASSARSSPSARMSASPKSKRSRKGKDGETNFVLRNPLSIETRDYTEPVRDMMAWANRPEEERHQEVDNQHKGNIPRPLNSFMLYRQAYKERIKKWGEQGNNNQLISRVAGESWNREPADVKDFYAKVAVVERNNHAKAFPAYKFAPNKNIRKRGRNNDEDESDPEWEGSSAYSGKRRRGRGDTESARSRSTTPAQLGFASPHYHPSSYEASNPRLVTGVPQYQQQWSQPVHYDQYYDCVPLSYHEPVHDYHYGPTSFPVHQEPYAHLVGMPPAGNGAMEGSMTIAAEYIDPGLSDFDASTSYQYGTYAEIDPSGEYDGDLGRPLHPGLQTLTAAEPVWSASGAAGSAFDAELDRWHGSS